MQNDQIISVTSQVPLLEHYQSDHPRTPSRPEVVEEVKELCAIAIPLIITSFLTYVKSAISMLFLGNLGKQALAGGTLSICIANISGYSVISGLSLGMEGISSQAHGARNTALLGQTLQRTIVLVLVSCLPISILWVCIEPILVRLGQDPKISSIASVYLRLSLPDLFIQSWIHPLRIFLRTQKITSPLMVTATFGIFIHAPVAYFLVCFLKLGIQGVAIAASITDLSIVAALFLYIYVSRSCKESWKGWSLECFCNWMPILRHAVPSCGTVCLEWWWYEIMIAFAGYLNNAPDAVATMGVLIQETALVYSFPSSLGQAISTRVGHELGRGRPERARFSSLVALACSLIMGLVAMSSAMIMGGAWGRLFTSDAAIVLLTATVLPVVGLSEVGNFPQTTGCGVLRGSSRPNLGTYVNTVAFYVIGLGPAYWMGFRNGLGLLGLWLGNLGAQVACAVVMVVVVLRTDWAEETRKAQMIARRSPQDYSLQDKLWNNLGNEA